MTHLDADRPAVALVSEHRDDFLRDEFDRYARDYLLRTARTCSEALAVVEQLLAQGRPLALVVTESRLPTPTCCRPCRPGAAGCRSPAA